MNSVARLAIMAAVLLILTEVMVILSHAVVPQASLAARLAIMAAGYVLVGTMIWRIMKRTGK